MASVSSLDKDLRKLRLDKYTPAAANEARAWIEGILGERLPGNDLLDGLKDGVALCKLVNLAVGPPGIKFKRSAMPFVQMENISHFLRACQGPPFNLQQHDTFLTVDLYEQKDPTQVLQCLGAFSRAASNANPAAFPSSIGPRNNRNVLSPQTTGPATPTGLRGRGVSNSSNASSSLYGRAPTLAPAKTGDSGSGRWSPTKSPPPQNGSTSPVSVSSWSKREHEGATSPAWNIAQYGYMGGASQGNLGIAFGGRRQITSAGPHVPNIAEKERRRKEQEAEAERLRLEAEEETRRRQAEMDAEEERARLEEERRWEEETRRLREEERKKAEEEKRRWEEEERQWKITEEKRRKDEEEAEAQLREERQRLRAKSDAKLRGQFLSQYQAEEKSTEAAGYSNRIKELEKELEQARQREAEYERERQRSRTGTSSRGTASGGEEEVKRTRARSRSRPPAQPVSRQDSWSVRDDRDERAYLRTQWTQQQRDADDAAQAAFVSPPPPSRSPRPLPDPTTAVVPPAKIKSQRTGGDGSPAVPIRNQHTGSRPLPDGPPAPAVRKQHTGSRPLPDGPPAPAVRKQHTGSRPLPDGPPAAPVRKQHTGSRPLPDPTSYASSPAPQYQPSPQPSAKSPFAVRSPPMQQTPGSSASRTDRYLASNPAPKAATPTPTYSRELGATEERDSEDRRRVAAQKQTKAGGWASKSLLEREMEMERQRQREWEESQKETAKAVRSGEGVDGIGGGVGGRWDVSQFAGYTGGDSQNRGQQGIGAGRRQIVGPRPLPSTPR